MEYDFISHLIELRKRLIYALIGFIVVLGCLFPFANHLYQLLSAPLAKFMPPSSQLIATDIISPFFVPLKLAALSAMIISLPNTLYQIWQFVSPGLYKSERRLIVSIISSAFVLFLIGILFCYFLVLPAIFHFVAKIKAPQIAMFTDIDKYLSFVLSLFVVFGIAFEMPVIIFLLIKFNILSLAKARQIRPYMFVGCFIIAAIVTPPDILSQTLLALPLYALYELGIVAGNIFIRAPILPESQIQS